MVKTPFFTGVKGAKAGFSVASDEWWEGGNPSAASTAEMGSSTDKKLHTWRQA